MKLHSAIQKHATYWALLILCCIFFILRFPSLYEPYWYGDEGIYHVIGRGLAAGRQMYVGVWDNKPPLLYVIYALFNADQFKIRLASLLFGVTSVIVFFFLSKKLFQSSRIAIITGSVFTLLLALPIIEGNIANAENFMMVPALLAGYLIYADSRSRAIDQKRLLIAGILLGISALTKVVGIFDAGAFALFIAFIALKSAVSRQQVAVLVKTYIPLAVGFIIPVLLVIAYFFLHHTFSYFIDSAFRGNVDYVGWKNDFLFPNGLLIFKSVGLSLFFIVLFIKRRSFSSTELFILLWLAASLFNAFFSHRPYTHYLLVLLPSFCLAIGLLFLRQSKKRFIPILGMLLLLFYIAYNHFDHWDVKRTALYYENFVSFMTGQKEMTAYQTFFDTITPRDYEIAAYIKQYTEPGDIIFLWGNSAQIYVLSDTLPPGRFSVAYHVITNKQTLAETEEALKKEKPKYIIIMPDQKQIPFAMTGYAYRVTIKDTFIYERIN